MISLTHELPDGIATQLLQRIDEDNLDQNTLLTDLITEWLAKTAA